MAKITSATKRATYYPLRYSEAAVILYLLSLEIPNLLKEIRDKSPVASKQQDADSLFNPGQIVEARKHFTAFIKHAIAVIARRQMALNMLEEKKYKIKKLLMEVEDGAALALQNSSYISEEGFKRIEKTLKTLKKNEDDVLAIENSLLRGAKTIDEMLVEHSKQWQEHQLQYVTQLIAELEKKGFLLSELEKNELKATTKTIDEVRQNLKKQALLKE